MLFFGYEFLKELYENVFAAPSVLLAVEKRKMYYLNKVLTIERAR